MTIKTIPGVVYVLSSSSACTVTATTENGTQFVLCALDANGGQKSFQAIAREVEVSDQTAAVVPFDKAPVPLGMDGGASAEQVTRMVEEALTDPVEASLETPEGTSNYECFGVFLAPKYVPVGNLRKVSMPTRKTRPSSSDWPGQAYLLIQEATEDGEDWVTVAVSQNAVAQVWGQVCEWVFDGETLHGRKLRMRLVTDPENRVWDMEHETEYWRWGLQVFEREEGDEVSGIFLYPQHPERNTAYVPHIEWSYEARVAKFTPLEHASDEELHLRDGERAKWNKAAEDLAAHEGDASLHLGEEQRGALEFVLSNKEAIQALLDAAAQAE